jgi:XapX domain-containing protein
MSWAQYLISLGVGIGVGVIYGLVSVRSPAPPIVALLGLLGMLTGEAAVQWVRGHGDAFANALHLKSFSVSLSPETGWSHPPSKSDT